MANEQGIIHATTILGNGSGTIIADNEISEVVHSDQLSWLHMDATNPNARVWLEKELSYLDHIILDALTAEETRPRILEFGEGVLMILRGVNLNQDAQPEDMVSIRVWIDKDRIVSLERRNLKAVGDILQRLKTQAGPKNSGDFATMLVARLFERMEPVLTELDEAADTIEESVMENPGPEQRSDINMIRKQAILFRRYMAPQRDVIARLRTTEMVWLDIQHRRRLQESLDHVTRYVEDLDAIRERAQIIKDELVSALSDRLNHNMYILSVVAATFLPLGFLTGLLGINVGGIPGADNPSAFLIFIGILIAISAAQIWIFKKKKWF